MNRMAFATTLAAIASGFVGGIASNSIFATRPVHAQVQVEPPDALGPNSPIPRPHTRTAPGEVTAERFVLVDRDGNVYGVIGMNGDHPEIDFYDKSGKVIWRAPFRAGLTPLAMAR
ncbi:MAG: hypothetical protein JO061_11260 [Acidobacteriaceae bacterium]|nr:hypothetical protein [Acidobacteriaceae bacterium]